jgi:hypothetical protein
MNKITRIVTFFVVVVLLFATAAPQAANAQGTTPDPTATFTVTGAPDSVSPVKADPAYKNTTGVFSDAWVGEPGVLTGDPGDAQCKANASCWWISPDNQTKLTDKSEEGLDLREGGYLFITFAGGHISIDKTEIDLMASPRHMWMVVLKGLPEADGDNNLPVTVSKYNAGFGLATNLPSGARMSQDYFTQNADNAYTNKVCGGGCLSVSAIFYDAKSGAWTAINQPGKGKAWSGLGTNFVGG